MEKIFIMLVHNIKRSFNIPGIPELIRKLKKRFFFYSKDHFIILDILSLTPLDRILFSGFNKEYITVPLKSFKRSH